MKYAILLVCSLFMANLYAINNSVTFVLNYKLNGVSKQKSLTLGIGAKKLYDSLPQSSSPSYHVGNWQYEFPVDSDGLQFVLGFLNGYKDVFEIGRRSGIDQRYYEIGTNLYRLRYGNTYNLTGETYTGISDITISTSSPEQCFKVTNATDTNISLVSEGVVKKHSAIFIRNPVFRVWTQDWKATYELHDEQDWSVRIPLTREENYFSGTCYYGNIIISDTALVPEIKIPHGHLIYGDMGSTTGFPLYGATNCLLYGMADVFSNVTVMTEWVFDQSSSAGTTGNPTAWINDSAVCVGHSTTHIIDYRITTRGNWWYDESRNDYCCEFTMQLTDQNHFSVVQRCWVSDYETFDSAPPSQRASSSRYTGEYSTFVVRLNKDTREITLVAK